MRVSAAEGVAVQNPATAVMNTVLLAALDLEPPTAWSESACLCVTIPSALLHYPDPVLLPFKCVCCHSLHVGTNVRDEKHSSGNFKTVI